MKNCGTKATGKIRGIIFFKPPSRYMIKKYGYNLAFEKSLKKGTEQPDLKELKFQK